MHEVPGGWSQRMLNDFYFAASITTPIFCILALGIFFKRIGWITDEFARVGSELVFRVTLPCLLFVKIVVVDFERGVPVTLVAHAVVATVVVFLLLDLVLSRLVREARDRGVFVQGAYRANMGIIGLAYCLSAFGDGVIATASIYIAVMTSLFNLLAVITLSRHQGAASGQHGLMKVFVGVLKNPLILSIVAAVAVSFSGIEISPILLDTGAYFAQMTLPLALVCAGASIRLHEFYKSPPLYAAVAGKLLLVPLLITGSGVLLGLRGESLGVLFLMCASPTAAASYPMAQAMGANHHLAAAIIAATSLLSVVASTLGIFILRISGLI